MAATVSREADRFGPHLGGGAESVCSGANVFFVPKMELFKHTGKGFNQCTFPSEKVSWQRGPQRKSR